MGWNKINILTGEITNINNVPINEAPSRAKMIVQNDDILISTTRPQRGAISFIRTKNILIASTGFCILRKLKNENINREYLFYYLTDLTHSSIKVTLDKRFD